MLRKKILSSVLTLSVISSSVVWAGVKAEDVVINASADFETGMGDFVVEASDASFPLEVIDKYPGWLSVGNGWGTLTVPDDELAGATDKVTVSFDVAYGKLTGKSFYQVITDSNGTELAKWDYRPYDGFVAANILGTSKDVHSASDLYSGNSTPITDRAANFKYEFDFASRVVTLTVHNNYSNSDTVHTAEIPAGSNNVKSLRIGSTYTNLDRRCVVDNLSITTQKGADNLIPYTINYTLDDEIVRSKTANVISGTKITAESVFEYDGVKYFALDDSTLTMTVTDGEDNTLNVPIRKAGQYNVKINAVGDVKKTLNEYTVWEGESVSYAFPMYMLNDTTLCVAQPQSSDVYYGGTVNNITENVNVDIDYLEMYENCVLYDELDSTGDGSANVRASNCSAYLNQAYTSSKEIAPGTYTFIVRYSSFGRGSTLKIGDRVIKDIGTADDRGSWKTAEIKDVTIEEGGYITLEAGGNNSRDALDTVVAISNDPLPEEPELYENRIKNIDKNDNEININVELNDVETGKLITAMYDIDGNLLKVAQADVNKDTKIYSFDVTGFDNIRTVKAYLWDSDVDMKPIAQTKEKTILITQKAQTTPSVAQQLQIDRKYGMFIHFGINTFSPNGLEWSDGTLSPSIYTPPTIDADQWIKSAKDAGMSYVILVTKHHEGFCLWDTEYTDYSVNYSPNTTDVVKAVAEACEKYGIKLGLYYSLWDRHERTYANDDKYAEYMKNQITELLDGRYGEIVEFWLDGGWEKTNTRWHMDELYDLVKRLQPNCVFGVNHTIGPFDSAGFAPDEYHPQNYQENMPMKYFPSDFRLLDPKYTKVGKDADPKLYMHDGKQYYLPFEATICVKQKGKWFWSPNYPDLVNTAPQHIAQKYKDFTEQDNVLIVNCAPNREGKLEQYDIDTINVAGGLLGIGAVNTDVYEFEDSNYTKGDDATSFGVSKAVADYSGTGFLGGWTSSCSAEFSINSDTDRTARISLAYGNGNGNTTANINVNGSDAAQIGITNTASWAFVNSKFVEVQLKAGDNKIKITTGPEAKGPNFDCMYVQ